MKIAIIGAGAIGSVVAGKLSQAGEDVLLVGRADQVAAIKENGLVIKSQEGSETVKLATEEQLDQEYDLVIFTVKTQDLEEAYQKNHRFLEKGLILTSQNGVQADNILSTHFERENMISSIVMFGATYIKPGEVTYNFKGDWIIGKPYSMNDDNVLKVADILKKAFDVFISYDIMGMKWLKLFVNFNNCVPALIGKSMQETFSDLDMCRLSVMLLKEGVGIITTANIELVDLPNFPAKRIYGMAEMQIDTGAAILNKTLTGLSKEPVYGSILQSILRKKSSEIDFINGEVAQIASSLRMETPLNTRIVDMVHKVELSGKFFSPEEIKKEFQLV